ncbi:MAG: transcriptional repressor [Eubacteriales bacterium]|jgi:Fe2+ or Zn2+ uptake regulation protein|nr:transcriptional repressor [Eubacteriales bacterium]
MVKTRNTKQRQLILEELRGTKSHPSAEWVYQRVKAKLPNISLGTVYRNLAMLKEQEIIQELPRAGSQSRYDSNPNPHYHFLCLECGRIDDVELPYLEKFNLEVAEKLTEYEVLGHFAEFYGLCPQCKKSK